MKQLTVLGAMFLHLEAAETPMHLASVHPLRMPRGKPGSMRPLRALVGRVQSIPFDRSRPLGEMILAGTGPHAWTALGIAVHTYAGSIDVGVIGCPRVAPDVEKIAILIGEAVDRLGRRASGQARKTGRNTEIPGRSTASASYR